jgi:hypothetical protein
MTLSATNCHAREPHVSASDTTAAASDTIAPVRRLSASRECVGCRTAACFAEAHVGAQVPLAGTTSRSREATSA